MRIVLAVLGCLVPIVASAATYHVSADGSDEADGGEATPWATLQHAADQVAAGDTVVVADTDADGDGDADTDGDADADGDGDGGDDDDGGCGCRTAGGSSRVWGGPLLVLGALALRARRRRGATRAGGAWE